MLSARAGALALAVVVAALLAAPPARAVVPDRSGPLEEIVVTAEKVRRSADSVARSISTLDGAFSEEVAAIDFEDLISYTANIEGRINPFGGTLRIRGLGTSGTNAGSEPAVGVVIDGVSYGRNYFLAANFFDLEQTEVLRGPQGTLFGKNATAGLLNITTRAPRPGDGARVETLIGEDGERVVRPAATVALGRDLALRVAGAFTRRDGRLRNTFLDRHEVDLDQKSMRAKLRYTPAGAPWRMDLSAFHSRQSQNNGQFEIIRASDAMTGFARTYDPAFTVDEADFRTSLNVPAEADVAMTGLALTNELDLPAFVGRPAVLTAVTGAAESRRKRNTLDADFTPAPFLRRSQVGNHPFRQFSQEVRLSGRFPDLFGAGRSFQYTAGLYFLRSSLRAADRFEIEDLGAATGYLLAANAGGGFGGAAGGLAGLTAQTLDPLLDLLDPVTAPLLGPEQRIDTLLDQDVRTMAVFGQSEYRFAPAWYLITGLRVGHESKDGDFRSQSEGRLIGLVGEQEDHETTIGLSERTFSPRVGLRWQPADTINAFATWARGSKSGGFNAIPLTPDNLFFNRERADSYEIGAKTRYLDGRLRVAATAFWTDFDDLQVSTFRDNRFFILNAAEARSRGVELDINWLPPVDGSAMYLSFGYNDAQFTEYPDAPAPADADSETQDLAGRPLPRAPRVTVVLKPSYSTLIDDRRQLVLSGDLQYRGKRFLDVDLDPRTLQPETAEVNLRATMADVVGGWALTLAARNLTEVVTLSQVLDQPLAAGNFVGIRADRGRFLSASLTLDF